jgi:hypothetical protein
MIFIPRKNIWTPPRKFGSPKFQKGILHPIGFWGVNVGEGVSLNSSNVTNGPDSSASVYAGVSYSAGTNNVFEYKCTVGGTYSISRGLWLDYGDSANVWFERTINSGSLNSNDPGSGRLQMNTARYVEVVDTSIAGGPVTCNLTITMWDASSGGNKLDEVTYTLSAEKEAGG